MKNKNKCIKDTTLEDIGYRLVDRMVIGNNSFTYIYYEKKYGDITYRITFYYNKYCMKNNCFFYKEIYDEGIYRPVNCFTVEEIYACANL